jgi:poly(3-hydroxybutyrate) depolymerase
LSASHRFRPSAAAVAALVLAALGGCAVPQPQNTPVQPKLVTDPTTGNPYYLYVPSTYRRDEPAPLIVSCHGSDPFDVAAHQVGEWKMLAEVHGCLLVCPKLSGTDGILGTGAPNVMLPDERRIMSAISHVQRRYNVDRENVMITGFSGGGFAVYFVGLRHPDVFTAAVSRSGNFNAQSIDGWYPAEARKMPVMVYYGQNDPAAIRAQSEQAVAYLRAKGFPVETKVIPGIGHERRPEVAMDFWLRHWNGTPPRQRLAVRN